MAHKKKLCYINQTDYPEHLKTLLRESRNVAALNRGAVNTIAGESWFNFYMFSLSKMKSKKFSIILSKTHTKLQNVDIPIIAAMALDLKITMQ